MANKRIDELPVSPGFALTDLLEKERDPAGTKAHEKTTILGLVTYLNEILGIGVFATIADLRATSAFSSSKVYIVLGNVTVDDGVTNFYRFSATDDSAENGLLVIIPTLIVRPALGSFIKLFP